MIKNRVPELMAERGVNATELMRGANISYLTARMYAHGKVGTKVDTEVLEKLCRYFGCEIGDVLVLGDDPNDQK